MKWACGANPELQDVFDSFTTSFVTEIESLKVSKYTFIQIVRSKGHCSNFFALQSLSGILKSVSSSANTVLQHEALRTGQSAESARADSEFMGLLGECQESAALKETHNIGSSLSSAELGLFKLSPPAGDFIDARWIRQTEETISTRVRTAKEQLRAEVTKCQELVPDIQQSGVDVVSSITAHQKLMADVGALLKTISKSEDCDVPEVTAYLHKYKKFSDKVRVFFISIIKHLNYSVLSLADLQTHPFCSSR